MPPADPEPVPASPPAQAPEERLHEEEEDTDAQAAAIAVPEDTGEGGKLKMIVSLVKRCFGVKDIASLSAPFLCLCAA